MKKINIIFLLILIVISKLHSQNLNPFYLSVVNNISYDSVLLNLQKFESLGVKEPGTQALNSTRDWLISKYSQYGYTDIKIDTFSNWGNELYNIIVSKTGYLHPDTFVIVDGHYDTNNGPGTNDNGSGVSVILEIARVIQNISTEYSIKFINFSAEESGYKGSDHYVSDIVNPQNMQIRIVFNIDEVGGVAGMNNNTVRCESDQSPPLGNNAASAAFTDTLTTLTQIYSSLNTTITNAYGSDYVPFQQDNKIITGFYEDNVSSFPHSANDLLVNLDTSYVYELAKAAAGATLYFARAYDIPTGNNTTYGISNMINVFPNPFYDKLYISVPSTIKPFHFTLFDGNGKSILRQDYNSASSIELHQLVTSSFYFYLITGESGDVIKSGKLCRIY